MNKYTVLILLTCLISACGGGGGGGGGAPSAAGGSSSGGSSFGGGGSSVGISADGNKIIIGALCNDGDTNNNVDCRGHARVYEYIE